MTNGFDDIQKTGKDQMDRAMQSFGTVGKGVQALAAEMADYSKASFEEGSAFVEKLTGARSFDKVVELQSDYMRAAYEDFIGRAGKFGELYADLARSAYAPFETAVAKGR